MQHRVADSKINPDLVHLDDLEKLVTDTGAWPPQQAAEDGTSTYEDTSLRVCGTVLWEWRTKIKHQRLYHSAIVVMLGWLDGYDVSNACRH